MEWEWKRECMVAIGCSVPVWHLSPQNDIIIIIILVFFFFFLFGQTQNWRHDVEDAIVLSYICKVNGERRRNNKTWEKYIYLEKFLYIIDKSFVIIYLLFMNEVCGWIGLIYSWGYWEENFLKHFEWTNLYRKIRFYMK